MDPGSALALAAAMAVLAAIPSLSVLTVTARAAAYGFGHGAAAAAGIVAGDLILIAVAIVGLSALAAALGDAFVWIKYLGGAYLIWQGVLLLRSAWRKTPAAQKPAASAESSAGASFMAGLLLTLADQKAVLFYLGFFPAFLDLNGLSILDITLVLSITVLTVGGVKLVYAALAARARGWAGAGTARGISLVAGLVMIAVGLALLLRG
ncbi:MAG: LysE family translocator [Burkholderiales bacterium]